MIKHSFKIGDKVKLKGSFCGVSGNDIGRVVSIDSYIKVSWNGYLRERLGELYPHRPDEIELTVKIGEQLQFEFMERN